MHQNILLTRTLGEIVSYKRICPYVGLNIVWRQTEAHLAPPQKYNMTFRVRKHSFWRAPNEDSNQPVHRLSLIATDKALFIRKMLISFLFLHENICCGHPLEAPRWGASNEYPQHMFSWRNKKNIMWIPLLICSYESDQNLGLSAWRNPWLSKRHAQSSRNLFYWCRTAVRQIVIFCRTDMYLQDWRHILCQKIIFFAKIHKTFVRQTKGSCRTKWKNANFVRQSCTFR